MNPMWVRALVLVCVFAAVVLAAEVLVRWIAERRAGGKAINLRLEMIGRGRSHGETMNLLRRTSSVVPAGLPPMLDRWAQKFERTLMQAQVVREQCQFTDGRAAERVAGFIVDEWRGGTTASCAASQAAFR